MGEEEGEDWVPISEWRKGFLVFEKVMETNVPQIETWVNGKNNGMETEDNKWKRGMKKEKYSLHWLWRMWREIDQWKDKGKIRENDFFLRCKKGGGKGHFVSEMIRPAKLQSSKKSGN